MAYIFPKRRLRDNDVLDPTELNEDFAPASDLYSGNLNEHNFEDAINPDVETDVYPTASGASTPILSNAYWNIYYAHKRVNPGWGTPDNYTNPESGAILSVISTVSNTPAWEAVDDTVLTIVTGNSKLWLLAQVQYIWDGWTAEGGHNYSYPPNFDGTSTNEALWARFPSKVQFAIRVNGQIVEGTKTGLDFPEEKMLQPYKTLQERTSGKAVSDGDPALVTPGPGHDGEENCGALSPECHSLRMGAFHSVSAGTHTIEIVYRRLALVTPDDFRSQYQASNKFYVANRQLLAVDYPVVPPATASAAVSSTPAYESEDVISRESLGVDRVNAVRAKFNDVGEGALRRGALNNNHLKSQISQKEQATISPALSQTFSTWYPGFDTSALASLSGGTTGWYLLNDGASNNLQIATSNWTISKESVILLLGNVEIYRINATSSASRSDANQFCALALGMTVGSSFEVLSPSEMVINRDTNMFSNIAPDPPGSLDIGHLDPVGHDVALMQIIKVGGAVTDSIGTNMNTTGVYKALNTVFQGFGIYGSTMRPEILTSAGGAFSSPAGPTSGVRIVATGQRGNILGIVFEEG
jgi:hypothetical protein